MEDPYQSHIQSNQNNSYFSNIKPIHIVSLTIFLILTVLLIHFIKKNLIKFLCFFHFREDYLRFQVHQKSSEQEPVLRGLDQTELNCHNTRNEQNSQLQNQNQTSKLHFTKQNLKFNVLASFQQFHSLFALIHQKVNGKEGLGLPKAVSFVMLLITMFMGLTLAIGFSQAALSVCQNQRSFLNTLYKCQNSDLFEELTMKKQLILAIAVSVIVCCLSMVIVKVFTRNYFKFMRNMVYPKIMKNQTSNFNVKNLNSDNEMKQSFQTQLNQENLESLEQKKNQHGGKHPGLAPASSDPQKLFQIQEIDEDNQPQSPNYQQKQRVLGDISNQVPQNERMRSSKLRSSVNSSEMGQEDLRKSQIFESHDKNQDKNKFQIIKQQCTSFDQKQNVTNTFIDQTTFMEGQINMHNISMCRQLEGIKEMDNEGNYKNGSMKDQDCTYNQNIYEEQYSKLEDISRMNILSQSNGMEEAPVKKKKVNRVLQVFIIALIVGLGIGLIGGVIFDLYSVFNMTEQGLKISLTVFGLELVIDFFALRMCGALSIGFIRTLSQKTQEPKISVQKYNKATLDKLSNLYFNFEVKFQDYEHLQTKINLEVSEDIEKQQLKKIHPKKAFNTSQNHQFDDFVLVEKTIFYQAPMHLLMNRELNSKETNRNEQDPNLNLPEHFYPTKKPSTNKGEKLCISNSISFRAEDQTFMKRSHITKGLYNDNESNYDIEEIPIHSSRQRDNMNDDQENDERQQILMPNHPSMHQFETPKLDTQGKNKLKMPNGQSQMFTQQIVSFNDGEQNARKSILRDMVGLSNSKKGSPNKSEYQSLKKYLAGERQNSMSSICENAINKFSSPFRALNNKSSKLIRNRDNQDEDEYNPAYYTMTKNLQKSQQQSSISRSRLKARVQEIKNDSEDEDKSVFSDIKNVVENEQKLSSTLKKEYLNNSQKSIGGDYENIARSKSCSRQQYLDKENLCDQVGVKRDLKPNLSPFNNSKALNKTDHISQSQLNAYANLETSSQKQIPGFSSIQKGGKSIVENRGLNDHNHSSLDLAENPRHAQSPEGNRRNWGSIKTVEDSIDNHVKKLLRGGKRKYKKNEKLSITQLQQLGSVQSNEFLSGSDKEEEKSGFKLHKVQMNKEADEYEANKSKVYEDNSRTYRLVNFGQKQGSVQQLNEYNSNGIDFYSNTQTVENPYKEGGIQEKTEQKTDYIHVEGSPEKRGDESQQYELKGNLNETSPSSNEEDQPYQSRRGVSISRMMKNIDPNELIEAAVDVTNIQQRLNSRKSTSVDRRKPSQMKKESRHNLKRSIETEESQERSRDEKLPQIPRQQKFKPQKEPEDYRQRIEEQKRKLKSFLKLAIQLKSLKDEQLIVELLDIIKQTKKPLPMSKINELKKLELMASPYNQSLIAMIKDEYEKFKKQNKQSQSSTHRNGRSQQRSDMKSEQVLKHLNGIYGTNTHNQTQLSQRKTADKSGLKASSMTRDETALTNNKQMIVNMAKRQVKNIKSVVRQSEERVQQHIQPEGIIRINKKNTQKPLAGYENSFDVNSSSLSNIGIPTSEDEQEKIVIVDNKEHEIENNQNLEA